MYKKKKGVSPLIATILLIVVVVAIIAIILSWGKGFGKKSLDQTLILDNLIASDASHFIFSPKIKGQTLTFNYSPPLDLKNKNIYIVGYSLVGESTIIPLDENTLLKEGVVGISGIDFSEFPTYTDNSKLVLITDNNNIINLKKINLSNYIPPELFSCDQRNAGGYFYSGDGSEQSPFGICDCQMFQDISNNIENVYYELLSNINCSDFGDFTPIGDWSNTVSNLNFEGNNFTISNIDLVQTDDWEPTGIFGNVANSEFNNLNLENISVIGTYENVSILTGADYQGVYNNITIDDSFINYNTGSSDYMGSLIGAGDSSTISNIAIENTFVDGDSYVGGIVGSIGNLNGSNLSFIDSNVSGGSYVGGIVGLIYSSTLSELVVNGNVFVKGTSHSVGGLVGLGTSELEISNSYAIANVSGEYLVGGIIGDSLANLDNVYFQGDVIGTGTGFNGGIGGLVGEVRYNSGDILNSYAIANVSGFKDVGGLVGKSSGNLVNVYFQGEVVGTSQYTGGLIGNNQSGAGGIANSFASGDITGIDYVGGLVGYSTGCSIEDSNFEGNIVGNNYVGGLLGSLESYMGNLISKNYVSASISGNDYVGGLSGNLGGQTINSYFIGDVNGNNYVGGLFGRACCGLNVENNYYGGDSITSIDSQGHSSYGAIMGIWSSGDTSTFQKIYYNNTQSGIDAIGYDEYNSGGDFLNPGRIEGKTSTQLKQEVTFNTWNFTTIWGIDEGVSYPYLLTNQQDPLPSD
jgi:flagellin-like protein